MSSTTFITSNFASNKFNIAIEDSAIVEESKGVRKIEKEREAQEGERRERDLGKGKISNFRDYFEWPQRMMPTPRQSYPNMEIIR